MTEKFKVFINLEGFQQESIDKLMKKCDVEIHNSSEPLSYKSLVNKLKDKDGVILVGHPSINRQFLEEIGPKLKVISMHSAGFDSVTLEDVKSKGVKVGYTPILGEPVAEYAVTLLLATGHRLIEANKTIFSGGWVFNPSWMLGTGVAESTVGIFGLGKIGQGVVKRLKAFDVAKFIYSSRSRKSEGDELGAEFVTFEELLKRSDFLVVTSAFNETTRGIFNKDAFSKMKRTAIFINVGRGGIVNQDDLIEALKNGIIARAGLDVMTPEPLPPGHPLLSVPNLTLMPHIGSAELTTRKRMSALCVENLLAGLEGRQMPYRLV